MPNRAYQISLIQYCYTHGDGDYDTSVKKEPFLEVASGGVEEQESRGVEVRCH